MYEKASRLKLRFNYKGMCSTEDLWVIPLPELDAMFKGLNNMLKDQNKESLLGIKNKDDEILELRINIIKDIVSKRLIEIEANKNKSLKTAQKQKLLEIIATKQDAALHDMSIEDLTKLVTEL